MNNRIAELRLRRGWSQQILAEKLGTTRQSINSYEAGRSSPQLKIAFKLAKVLNTPLDDIYKVPENDRPTIIEAPTPPGEDPGDAQVNNGEWSDGSGSADGCDESSGVDG